MSQKPPVDMDYFGYVKGRARAQRGPCVQFKLERIGESLAKGIGRCRLTKE